MRPFVTNCTVLPTKVASAAKRDASSRRISIFQSIPGLLPLSLKLVSAGLASAHNLTC
ncbi:Uncharacterised protein [Vibrio cholerae]|nr:Uncharacterised protein [Vibrio cholerae]CSI61624.1 Uncharacterised protein [Vibrio cholerae]CSI66125.1 Uncharacterised protein [Vibrio cholerae]